MIRTSGSWAARIDAPVAVVGAGPSGLALALALARAGIETVVVESGLERIDRFAASLARAEALHPINHVPLEHATHRRLGGASWIWGGRCVDFDPIDFEAGRHGGTPGWPITYQEATAEAQGAADFLGLGHPGFDLAIDRTRFGGVLHARLERWCANPRLAAAHRAEIRRDERIRIHTGLTCTGVALEEHGRLASGLRVKTRSGQESLVTARHYVIAAGGIETARLLLASPDFMRTAIGAGGGWLGRGYMGHLQSAIADIVLDGLGEQEIDYRREPGSCFIRTRLMLAPDTVLATGLRNIAFLADNPSLGDWRHKSGALSITALALNTPVVGRALQPGPIRQLLLGQRRGIHDADLRFDIARHLRNVLEDVPGATTFAVRQLAARLSKPRRPGAFVHNRGRRYTLKYYSEQSPAFDSRVTLSNERDPLGTPRVAIEKRVSGENVESVLTAHDILDQELRRLALGRLEFRGERDECRAMVSTASADGYHQIGLARMGTGPETSVVDANCAVHGIANLHVAGSAVFPTSGQANPTYLAVCLALRLAKRLTALLKSENSAPESPSRRRGGAADPEKRSCQDA